MAGDLVYSISLIFFLLYAPQLSVEVTRSAVHVREKVTERNVNSKAGKKMNGGSFLGSFIITKCILPRHLGQCYWAVRRETRSPYSQ